MTDRTKEDLLAEIDDLKTRLREAEDNLAVIRTGGVDALVISGPQGEQVYTLNEADTPYRLIIEEMNEGTVTTNEQGVILYSNKQFSKMLGVPLSKIMGSSLYDHVISADHPIIQRFLFDDSRGAGKAEVVFKGESKENVWASVAFSPLQIEQTLVFCVIITDITFQKNVWLDLQEREERFRILADTIPTLAWMADEQGRIFWYNRSWHEYTGMTLEEMTGPEGLGVYHPDQVGEVMGKLGHCIETGKDCEGTLLLRAKDGEYQWFQGRVIPSRDEKGNIIRWIWTGNDITERKRIEAELSKTERNLVEAQRIGRIGSWEWDIQTGEVHWSSELYTLYGVDSNTFTPSIQSFSRFVHPGDRELMDSIITRMLSTGMTFNFDFRIISADGATRILNTIAEITEYDESGKPRVMVGVNQDVTERKQAEERILRQNLVLQGISRIFEETIRSRTEEDLGRACLEVIESITGSTFSFITESGPDGLLHDIAISDPGWELCTMYDKTGHRRQPGDFAVHGLYGRVVQDGRSLMVNDPSSHPDSIGVPAGHPHLTAFLGVPLFYDGRPKGMIGVANRDGGYRPEDQEVLESLAPVVEEAFFRKRMEEELRKSDERFRAIISSTPDHIIVQDSELRYSLVVNPQLGLSVQEMMGKTDFDVLPKEAAETLTKIKRQVLETGEPVRLEMPVSPPHGDPQYFSGYYIPKYDQLGRVDGLIGYFRNVTGSKLAEEELRRHRDNLEELVRERTKELEERSTLLQDEILQRRRAEEDNKRLESHLFQAQKMEALGRFASGIAHDMNNLIYPVLINTQMLLDESLPGSLSHRTLDMSLSAVYRQRDLIKQLLSFSRKDEQQLCPVQVKPLLQETVAMMRALIPSTIRIKLSMIGYRDMVLGNPTQIQQIIMNLCRNAADAMASQKGSIEVSLGNVSLDSSLGNPDIKPGEYLKLTVKDTGCGMTPEVMSRIFEPFFTTKEVGKGTGMGLAVIHGIVKAHRGAITVESEPERGTQFTVYLPLVDEDRQAMKTVEECAHPAGKGMGKILLVDDEVIILESVRQALHELGYEVVTGINGREAIEAFSVMPESFDLVITDVTMPGMTGMELAAKLLEIRPGIPIIMCTGLSETIDSQKMEALGVCGVLDKPADVGEVKAAIDRVLGP